MNHITDEYIQYISVVALNNDKQEKEELGAMMTVWTCFSGLNAS